MHKVRIAEFGAWWNAPITKRDRITGALVGAFGGFWIGALGKIMFTELPVTITVVALWGLAAAALFSWLGAAYPKVVTCIGFPFSIFGTGN